ncbi:hypothetical protein GGX14DRAFT_399743 [Mycena pura]|uniref:Uncharacterized protein n=1 Tax=Mycena pura TaxID=153505 RepID=A0AAD6V434_9AGAR|nr:hypothetical protein GGX14DRAFT_399743 [Mycena pura]
MASCSRLISVRTFTRTSSDDSRPESTWYLGQVISGPRSADSEISEISVFRLSSQLCPCLPTLSLVPLIYAMAAILDGEHGILVSALLCVPAVCGLPVLIPGSRTGAFSEALTRGPAKCRAKALGLGQPDQGRGRAEGWGCVFGAGAALPTSLSYTLGSYFDAPYRSAASSMPGMGTMSTASFVPLVPTFTVTSTPQAAEVPSSTSPPDPLGAEATDRLTVELPKLFKMILDRPQLHRPMIYQGPRGPFQHRQCDHWPSVFEARVATRNQQRCDSLVGVVVLLGAGALFLYRQRSRAPRILTTPTAYPLTVTAGGQSVLTIEQPLIARSAPNELIHRAPQSRMGWSSGWYPLDLSIHKHGGERKILLGESGPRTRINLVKIQSFTTTIKRVKRPSFSPGRFRPLISSGNIQPLCVKASARARPLSALSVPSQCPLSALSAHAVSVRASLLGPRSASARTLSGKKSECARALSVRMHMQREKTAHVKVNTRAHSAPSPCPLSGSAVPAQCPLRAVSVRASLLGPRSVSAHTLSKKKLNVHALCL